MTNIVQDITQAVQNNPWKGIACLYLCFVIVVWRKNTRKAEAQAKAPIVIASDLPQQQINKLNEMLTTNKVEYDLLVSENARINNVALYNVYLLRKMIAEKEQQTVVELPEGIHGNSIMSKEEQEFLTDIARMPYVDSYEGFIAAHNRGIQMTNEQREKINRNRK